MFPLCLVVSFFWLLSMRFPVGMNRIKKKYDIFLSNFLFVIIAISPMGIIIMRYSEYIVCWNQYDIMMIPVNPSSARENRSSSLSIIIVDSDLLEGFLSCR